MQQKRSIRRGELGISLVILVILLLPFTVVISEATPSIITHSPIIISSSVSPTKVQLGDLMLVSAVVFDFFGVERVEAKFFHEQGFDIVNLSRVIGSNHLGVWQGQWMVHDTKIKEYSTVVTAFSKSGLSSSKDLTWEDPIPWWNLNWDYRKVITLDSGQVPSDQANIPILISVTDTDLRDHAQDDGDDIAFTDSSGNQLNHEIEHYTSSTGKLVAWVNITSLSSSTDTEVYMYYSNSACSSQENAAGVWADHSMVYHLNEPTGTTGAGSVSDSTGSTSGTPSVGISFGETGKIGNATDFSSGTGINCGTVGSSILTADTTISFWIYSNSYSSPSGQNPFDHSYGGWGTMTIEIDKRISWLFGSNGGDASPYGSHQSSKLMANGKWIWVTGVRDDTSKTYTWYKNGEYLNSNSYSASYPNIQNQVFTIGDGYENPVNGLMDEFRIAKSPRTANWIKTQYNNVINASNGGFYTVGTEEAAIPTAPTLSFPSNSGYTNDIAPTFQWTIGDNAINNTFILDNESDLTDGDEHINISLSGSASSYTVNSSKNLSEGRWYWKVIANNSRGSNSSDVWSFIVDITGPDAPSLSSPAENESTSSNSVTFTWYAANDSTVNTTEVSNIDYYQLQVDNNSDFSSPLINNENTADSSTLSLTETVTGQLYWRVRAVDQAGNFGNYSASRNLTVFNFLLTSSASSLNILKGNSQTVTISIAPDYGVAENITLSTEWDETPDDVSTNFSTTTSNSSSWSSTLTITIGGDAPTEDYICFVNGTSDSGVTKSVQIAIDINSMTFLVLADSASFSMIRDDSATTTLSTEFLTGAKEVVSLSGSWHGTSPSDVTATISPSSGTPSYDSTLTISTSKKASAGSYTYRVTGSGGGMSRTVDVSVEISTNLSLTISTDDSSYEKGQEIQISGTAKDPDGNSVGSGTATIQLSATNWSDSFTTSITSGTYITSYYITFDKPGGDWTVSVTATDSHGHETSSSVSTSISVVAPEIYEHYSIDVLSPTAGQLFKRGETVTFTISLVDEDDEKIQGADVKACFSSGEEIVLSEKSLGVYSTSYDLGYDFQIGSLSLYVESKKYEDGKLKAGFNYIDFEVQSVEPILELIEPKAGDFIEVGETIKIKIKALYPDGTPLEESVITAVGPDGEELIFIRSKEAGIYVASYTPSADDFGDWAIQIKLEDAYGNSVVLEGVNVEIVHSRAMSILLRYWWATLAGVIATAALVSYLVHRKLRKIKFFNLKNEILELGKLKKSNAILYFLEGEITREMYDQLSNDYESKIAHLSKKQRMLEKRIEKKKKNKKTKAGENEFKKKS